MASSAAAFIVVFAILVSSVAAHNITNILSQYPEFVSFNEILSQTKVADEINRRQTITVLAVANSELDVVSGRPLDQVENIIRVHVVLDYYDNTKLTKLSKKTALLTTLFQATGRATGQAGFLNATDLDEGKVAFGSAVAGAGLDVYLVKSVAAHPYNISVLQVSGLIVPPNVDHLAPPTPATPPPAPTPSIAPPKKAEAPKNVAPPPAKKSDTAAAPAPSTTFPKKSAATPTASPPRKAAVTTPAAAPAKKATAAAPVPATGRDNGDASSTSPSEAPAGEEDPVGAAPADSPVSTAATPAGSIANAPAAADGPATAAAPTPDATDKHKSSGASHVTVGSAIAVAVGAALLGAF